MCSQAAYVAVGSRDVAHPPIRLVILMRFGNTQVFHLCPRVEWVNATSRERNDQRGHHVAYLTQLLLTCKLLVLNIGISKDIEMGPTSFRMLDVDGDDNEIRTRSTCSAWP